ADCTRETAGRGGLKIGGVGDAVGAVDGGDWAISGVVGVIDDASPDELLAIEDRVNDLAKNLAAVFEKKLASLGIGILPLARVDPELLLGMSIETIPPFEDSHEKGFRDSLIMFSILEAIKGQPEKNALLVTNDKLLTEGILASEKEYGTSINVVADTNTAVVYIVSLVDEVLRARRNKEKLEAKELLLKYRPEIETAVDSIREFSIWDLPSSLSGGSVERILSFTFNDINSATWKTRTENSATILFSLKCTLTAIVGQPLWELMNRTRYQVGGGITMLTPTNQEPKETTIEKVVFGVAEFVKNDGGLKLARLPTSEVQAFLVQNEAFE
ncbi:MAG: PIN domain-containing protein, partial [Candidatus Acidiferrum sp.]